VRTSRGVGGVGVAKGNGKVGSEDTMKSERSEKNSIRERKKKIIDRGKKRQKKKNFSENRSDYGVRKQGALRLK